eukprot:TRINITY_DN5587_c0_g1_i1.p1 TRINITY_DN5587_c0_g1~~TRINITY_DN5587_c0_g1_i1.p1  ORF type:complete len:302 (-),score=30.00 TRINITY_DN5587_c0_g1_i1:34-864(-)
MAAFLQRTATDIMGREEKDEDDNKRKNGKEAPLSPLSQLVDQKELTRFRRQFKRAVDQNLSLGQVSILNFEMTPLILRTALSGAWVAEEIINAYGTILASASPQTIFMTNHWSQQLSRRGYDHVASWNTTKLMVTRARDRDVERVLIPINVNDNHWILAALYMRERQWYLFDPMGTLPFLDTPFYKEMSRFLDYYFGTPVWNLDMPISESNRHQSEQDASSCGIYVCYYLELLCNGYPPSDIAQFNQSRKRMNEYRGTVIWTLKTEIPLHFPVLLE